MRNKIIVDKEVMIFTNHVLSAAAVEKPLNHNLTSKMHQEWWDSIVECQKSVKIYVNDTYRNQINLEQFGRIGNPHDGFKKFFNKTDGFFESLSRETITESQLKNLISKNYFAPEADNTQGREYTKFRVIVSEVPMVNQDGSLTKIKVITTCAPNLMGTSHLDMQLIDSKTQKVNQAAYKKVCEEIANLVVYAARDNQVKPLKISEFGLGVYISKLSEQEKNVARSIMYKAFADASQKYSVEIDWLIWNKNTHAPQMVKNLNDHHFQNYNFIQSESGDLIADVEKWKVKNPSVGELNNGSDRTIGGHLTAFKPKTTEEQLGQASLFVFIQSTLNPCFLNNVTYVDLNTNQTKQIQPSKNTTNSAHTQLKLFDEVSPKPSIDLTDYKEANRTKDNQTEFSYKTKEQAQALVELLNKHNIVANTFHSRGYERVVFTEQNRREVQVIIAKFQSTNQEPKNTTNLPQEIVRNSNETSGLKPCFINSPIISNSNTPLYEVRLLDGIRVTRDNTKSCYEISCQTEAQSNSIQYALNESGIDILEVGTWNKTIRIKFAPSLEALSTAQQIVGYMNQEENEKVTRNYSHFS